MNVLKENKHLMTGPKGNSEFCFPETLNVPRGEDEGNFEGRGETKLTVSKLEKKLRKNDLFKDGAY